MDPNVSNTEKRNIQAQAEENNLEECLIMPGKPLTQTELFQLVEAARERVANGDFTTMIDLEKEIEEW